MTLLCPDINVPFMISIKFVLNFFYSIVTVIFLYAWGCGPDWVLYNYT